MTALTRPLAEEMPPHLMAVEKPFSLTAAAKALLDDFPVADPTLAAEKLIETFTDEQCRVALAVCLPGYMRNFTNHTARAARKPKKERLTTPDRVRAWYAQALATRMFNGSEWKFLRDCTADDLQAAAAERYKTATQSQAEADRLVKLADLMEELEAETVEQVPENALKEVWQS